MQLDPDISQMDTSSTIHLPNWETVHLFIFEVESEEIHRNLQASMMKKIQNFKSATASLDDATIEKDTSGYCPADRARFSWKIDDWEWFLDNKFSSLSPIFVDKDGYSWQIKVFPNGSSSSSVGYLSVAIYLVAGDNDRFNMVKFHWITHMKHFDLPSSWKANHDRHSRAREIMLGPSDPA